MPVHVDYRNAEGNPLLGEPLHQSLVALLRVLEIAAPPVPQGKPGEHGGFPAQIVKILQALAVVMSIAPEINILYSLSPRLHPAVTGEDKGAAVIQDGKSVLRHQAPLQGAGPVHPVQGSGRPPQLLEIFSVVPDAAVIADISQNLDA